MSDEINKESVYEKVFFVFSIISVLQCMFGIAQFFRLVDNSSNFSVVGGFDNPAGFAACLSVGFPSTLYFVRRGKKFITLVSIIGCVTIALATVLSGSRTGLISMAFVFAVWLFTFIPHSKKFPSCIIPIIISLVFILSIVGLYYLKVDSANGRLFIWRNTWSMFLNNPLSRFPHNSFKSDYMLCQADYFINNPESTFIQIADNVSHPFNEYLLLLVNYGIVGFFILLGLIFFLLFCYFKNPCPSSYFSMLCLASIAIFSFFSYPFRYPLTWISVFFCCSIVLANSKIATFSLCRQKWLIYTMLILNSFFLFRVSTLLKYEIEWAKVAKKAFQRQSCDVLSQYKLLNSHLCENYLFLYNYSVELRLAHKFNESLNIAKQCGLVYNDYDLQLLIADNYLNLKEYSFAEKHFRIASKMCPNRFVPLFYLFKIKIYTSDYAGAVILSNLILIKPVKVASPTINYIKSEVRAKLTDIANSKNNRLLIK